MMYNDTRYLQDEIDRLKDERERDREDRRRQEQERQEEWKEQREIQMRSASTWPESLRKQITLVNRELSSVFMGGPTYENGQDEYFTPMVQACERALTIWKEVEDSRKERIAALEAQIAELRDGIRLEVADKLASENNTSGWRSVADAIRDEDMENWLNW